MKLSKEAFLQIVESVLGAKQTVTSEDLQRVVSIVDMAQAEVKEPKRRKEKSA